MTSSPTGAGGLEARPPEPQPPRTPEEIEAEIERTRLRLGQTVDAVVERVKPANVLHRAIASIKAKVVDETGRPRSKRIVIVGVVAAMAVTLLLVRRRKR